MRTFEILGSRSFQLVENLPGIEELIGGGCVTYQDKEDLKNKINYYIHHPEDMDKIAGEGHSIAVHKHTFKQRMNELLTMMNC